MMRMTRIRLWVTMRAWPLSILFLVRATPAYIACRADSTASLTTSILAYRNIRGRTYHSDRYSTDYFLPNDGQQLDSMDITYDIVAAARV